ncbi:hypothetical protein Tco_0924657 [Tanacetum coccineum]|uniref:Aminotransferase-like plant mobile domain-containing protein n=1 Tax=Tanacetum coccineum TaxID=301880 RepID=A0ABQ5D5E4_9ASTR
MWLKPGGLVYYYPSQVPQSSYEIVCEHVSRALISVRNFRFIANDLAFAVLSFLRPTLPSELVTLVACALPSSIYLQNSDSLKAGSDHFFWVVLCLSHFVPFYTGGILGTRIRSLLLRFKRCIVRLLESMGSCSTIPGVLFIARWVEQVLPFDDISYPALNMGWLDFIQTADPRKVRAVEVQKGVDQVTLLESTKDCFMPLVIPAAGGSSSAAAAEVPVPTEERQEDVAPEDAYLNLADPDEDVIAVRQGEERVVSEQPKKVKRRRLVKQNYARPSVVPPSQKGKGFVDLSAQGSFQILLCGEFGTLSARWILLLCYNIPGPFTALKPADGCRVGMFLSGTISNDFYWDGCFSCRTLVDCVAPPAFFSDLRTMSYDQLFTEFNVGATRQICLGSEVRSRTKHELELKEKLIAKYAARGKLLEERDLEILELKILAEKETEAAEAIRLRESSFFAIRGEVCFDCGGVCAEGRAVDFGNYINAVKDLEDVEFPLVNLLKSKKDAGMDEVLDCFLLDGPAADLPEASCRGGKEKHVQLPQAYDDLRVSDPLSSQTWVGEASTSAAPLSIEDYQEEDTDEALGSVVVIPQLEAPYL